ncbi:MAG TPA: hypothetical protein DDZ51_06935 [Planctomycetaceae bacterium]|nr:hypothetical protein [Planctomycetaceae bacterium]
MFANGFYSYYPTIVISDESSMQSPPRIALWIAFYVILVAQTTTAGQVDRKTRMPQSFLQTKTDANPCLVRARS